MKKANKTKQKNLIKIKDKPNKIRKRKIQQFEATITNHNMIEYESSQPT